MANSFALEKLNMARRAIAEAKTIPEAKELLDKFTALAEYAKRQRLELEVQNEIAECRIWTRRKIGVLLEAMPKDHGARPPDAGFLPETPRLEDMGISKAESSRLQSEASIPSGTVADYIQQTREHGEEVTSAGVRRLVETRKNQHTMDVMGSSESPEWYTPQGIIDLTLEVLGQIDLDPCSNSHDDPNVPAQVLYTKDDDGLMHEWAGRVYMNPPYGTEIADWTEKLVESYEHGNVQEAIALLPGRIDTRWFQPLYEYLICHIRGRLRFVGGETGAPFPSVVVYLGPNEARFAKVFSRIGPIMQRVA